MEINVWISVLIYCSYCVMPNSPILISIGNVEEDKKTRNIGITAGAVALGVCLLFINGAMLKNYQAVGISEIPMVELARNIWKPLGIIYAVILVAAMLMYGKEASNRKQEIDRQHYTIPNQRPKDKHCGKI